MFFVELVHRPKDAVDGIGRVAVGLILARGQLRDEGLDLMLAVWIPMMTVKSILESSKTPNHSGEATKSGIRDWISAAAEMHCDACWRQLRGALNTATIWSPINSNIVPFISSNTSNTIPKYRLINLNNFSGGMFSHTELKFRISLKKIVTSLGTTPNRTSSPVVINNLTTS